MSLSLFEKKITLLCFQTAIVLLLLMWCLTLLWIQMNYWSSPFDFSIIWQIHGLILWHPTVMFLVSCWLVVDDEIVKILAFLFLQNCTSCLHVHLYFWMVLTLYIHFIYFMINLYPFYSNWYDSFDAPTSPNIAPCLPVPSLSLSLIFSPCNLIYLKEGDFGRFIITVVLVTCSWASHLEEPWPKTCNCPIIN